MSRERLRLIAYLVILLVFSFGLLNLMLFLELRHLVEKLTYSQAYIFYITQGMEYSNLFVFWKEGMEGYRVYSFRSHTDPFSIVNVGVPHDYINSTMERIFIQIIAVEFILTFLLANLYLMVVEGFLGRLKEHNERLRDLGLAVMHKVGNFLSTQSLNLKMLRDKLGDLHALLRMEKSLSGFQRDINLIYHILEEKQSKKEWIDLTAVVEEILGEISPDYPLKRCITRLKRAYVHADRLDIESIVYNLINNAFKHSVSTVHVRLCASQGKALLVVRNDVGGGIGTGLGLQLLQKAVQRQGGKLSVKVKRCFTVFVALPSA